jgi:L-aminopeptidase/D-esterase-like protein
MPRATDLGITIGLLPSGPAGSVLDVPGAGLGHATIRRDEPPPPAGRGIARTGVTVVDPGGDLFTAPVPAGAAVLNGAGECTGLLTIQEWGLAETPVFLTSTMQVGRVHGSGEIFLALATGLRAPRDQEAPGAPVTGRELDGYFAAVVEATEEAVLNSLLQAETVSGRDGHVSARLPADELRRILAGHAGNR